VASANLCCRVVRLQYAEDVTLGIFEVGEPANARNWHFRQGLCATLRPDICDGRVNVRYTDGANISNDRITIDRPLALHNGPVDARLAIRAGSNRPVIPGAFPFGNLPVKDLSIECRRPFRIVRVDFKMNHSRHRLSFLSEVFKPPYLRTLAKSARPAYSL